MDNLEIRSKQMSLDSRLKTRREERAKTLQDIRKDKRRQLFDRMRGLEDEEWFDSSTEDLSFSETNLCDDSKTVHVLIDYINGNVAINEYSVKNYVQITKKYLLDNEMCCQPFISVDFFVRLSAMLSNPYIPNALRYALLDLIESILSSVEDSTVLQMIVLKTGIMSSVMVTTRDFDIGLVTKTVSIMKTMTDLSHDILTIALNNGYLVFLVNLLESNLTSKQKKKLFSRNRSIALITEKKQNLIQKISSSLVPIVDQLSKTQQIIYLLGVFERLLHYKDNAITVNILTALNIMVEKSPLMFTLLNQSFIISMTELIDKNNEDITSAVIHFWLMLCERIDSNDEMEKHFLNLMIESNVLKGFCDILMKLKNSRLVKEVVDFLTIFVEKHSIGATLLAQFNVISVIFRVTLEADPLTQRRLLVTIQELIMRINSIDLWTHFNQMGLSDVVVVLGSVNDPDLNKAAADVYQSIQLANERFSQTKA